MIAPTLADRLTAADGRPAGFDYLRLALALAIFAWHCIGFTDQPALRIARAPLMVGPAMALVPAFFALSGFLVAGSLVRNPSLLAFGTMRAARIIPALFVDTLFSALILGPIFTSLTLEAYFAAPEFWRYFLNIAGIISFKLPGVFTGNPSDFVNSQLWTIPWELYAYVGLFLAAAVGIFWRRWLMLLATLALDAGLTVRIGFHGLGTFVGDALVPSFLTGACAYLYRDRIPVHGLAIAAALAMVVAAWPIKVLAPLLPWATIYATLALGVLNPQRNRFIRSGDYSYGIYLYSLPIIQALIAAVPFARTWWGALLLATPCVLLFAAASWHGVEKHALKARARIVEMVEKAIGRQSDRRPISADHDGA